MGSNYPLFFRLFPVRGDNDPTTVNVLNSAVHLAWGDVAVDSIVVPTCVRVHLKQSKYDQFGKRVDVYVGDELCPVAGLLAYITLLGTRHTSDKSSICRQCQGRTTYSWGGRAPLCQPQLSYRGCHYSYESWHEGLPYPKVGQME